MHLNVRFALLSLALARQKRRGLRRFSSGSRTGRVVVMSIGQSWLIPSFGSRGQGQQVIGLRLRERHQFVIAGRKFGDRIDEKTTARSAIDLGDGGEHGLHRGVRIAMTETHRAAGSSSVVASKPCCQNTSIATRKAASASKPRGRPSGTAVTTDFFDLRYILD